MGLPRYVTEFMFPLLANIALGYGLAVFAGFVLHGLGIQGYWGDNLTERAVLFAILIFLVAHDR